MEGTKQERILEIFFRSLRGEDISVRKLATQYNVSTKSISRAINDIKAFLSDHRDLVGNTELQYSHRDKCYRLHMDEFLTNKELFALIEVIIGARAFSKEELLLLMSKLKAFTTTDDRAKLNELIRKELYHYTAVKHDCDSVQDMLWQLVNCITEKREITVEYFRSDRVHTTHRLRPASVLFTDFYFYLIAFGTTGDTEKPLYFRIDRIKHLTIHRQKFTTDDAPTFDEGLLRQRSLFMWPGKLRTIRFAYTGVSVQAVLDKLPTARVIDRSGKTYIVEAEVYGDGIIMWLLSQGPWIKVLEPQEFVETITKTLAKTVQQYTPIQEGGTYFSG